MMTEKRENKNPSTKKDFSQSIAGKIIFFLFSAWILFQASSEFYAIAWGTGTWSGEFSRSWLLLYLFFTGICIILFICNGLIIWTPTTLKSFAEKIITVREFLGYFRWVLWLLIFILPIYFFQYTAWGLVFQKYYIRLLVWCMTIVLLTILASHKNQIIGWNQLLISIILTASAFSIMASLREVSSYPFSLGWSEGNRLWDYSILFGSDLYTYPSDKRIFVLLDLGRQFIGGLPFIFPDVTILTARLWVGLTLIIPYLLLGVAAFRLLAKEKLLWFLGMLWVFLFLKQGPIHPPLVVAATFVVLAWRSPYWISIPLLMIAGYVVQASRFTWMYAPPLWIFMLEVGSASFSNRVTATPILKRAAVLVFSAFFGAFFLASSFNAIKNFSAPQPTIPVATQSPIVTITPIPETNTSTPSYIELIIERVIDQPLLWYRLLPNATYGNGILYALLLAVGPITIILLYLINQKIWTINKFQKIVLTLPLLAFLVVGLVASTKIGGGGDLHNMDMFLIGVLFITVMAWQNGGREWIQNADAIPSLMKIIIILLLVISSIAPLFELRSYTFGEDIEWLRILTDSSENNTLEMLPTQDVVNDAIQTIQTEIDKAKLQGDILFIDQRQLLTFGFIKDVPLVPAYEKKLLMNEALSANAAYFKNYYADLAAKRFSLIISEPLRTPIQDSSFQFGEENNAWVTWVAAPTLCYYEPLLTIKAVRVQLLIPAENTESCSLVIPE